MVLFDAVYIFKKFAFPTLLKATVKKKFKMSKSYFVERYRFVFERNQNDHFKPCKVNCILFVEVKKESIIRLVTITADQMIRKTS